MKFDFNFEDRLIRLICLSVSFCTVACSSQKTQDLVSSLVGTTAAVPPTSGAAFSKPAFSFLPGLYDFGGKILNSISTIGVTVHNVSGQSLYLASITSPSVHYTISSSTCPPAPAPIAADATCLVNVQFGPKSAGSLGSNLQLYFSTETTAGASVYLSAGTALLGTGLTTLSFAGLQAISGVTTTSMVLSWSADPVASAYMVYQIQAGSMVYLKTVNNVGGSVSGTVMTGLTPNTPYTFRVRAIDSLGSAESNTVDVSATTRVPGAFSTATLTVAEGATASLNLTTLCTDLYSTAPSSFTLTAMTSTNTLPHCSIVGSNLQCAPDYKTGHAGWTETATIVCRINQSDLTQNFTLNVTDTNISASLAAIGNQTVLAGLPITNVDANGSSDSQIDGDVYSYACLYDTVVDGTVAPGTACSSLAGAGFNTTTGILNWTTTFAQGGQVHEFKITSNDGVTTASRVFAIQVDSAVPIIGHAPAGNRVFPSNQVDQNSTLSWDFTNTRINSDNGMTYTCAYDQIVDGAVSPGSDCSTLPGTLSFNSTTGLLNWQPGVLAWGSYEFKIAGTNAAGSAAEIAVVDVRPPYLLTDPAVVRTLKVDLDAEFSAFSTVNTNAGAIPTTWRDLSTTATDATLVNTAGTASSGWAGNGMLGNPYRLALDGVNNFVNLGSSVLASTTQWLAQAWINPTNVSGTGKVILTNLDGSGNGFQIRQSTKNPGKINFSLAQASGYSQVILNDSPSLYWRLGSDSAASAVDLSGNGKTGTYSGTVTQGAVGLVPAQGDTALDLSGGGIVTSNLTLSTTHTVEVWAKTNSLAAGPMLWATNVNFFDLFFAGGVISMNSGDGASNSFGTIPVSATDGQFHHYVTIFNSNGNYAKLYFDGALYGTASYRNPSGQRFQLSHASYPWTGTVDEAAVYSYELTPTQIATHYGTIMGCETLIPLANNRWYNISTMNQLGQNRIYLNGQPQCSFGGTYSASAANLNAGSQAGTNAWSGALADLKVYSLGAASTPDADVATNFEKTANRFRPVPVENIVSDSLALHLDAANAREGTTQYASGCASADLKWADLSPNHSDATLQNFSPSDCTTNTTGWQGTGAASYPNRLRFNGSNHFATGSVTAGTFAGDFTIDAWIYRTSITNYPGIFSTNTDSNSNNSPSLDFFGNSNTLGVHRPNTADTAAALDLGADHLNQWLYVSLRREGGTMYVDAWKNGTHLSMNTPINWPINTAQVNYYVGRIYYGGLNIFSGDIPVVRVYTRKLSDAELLQNCRAQDGRFPGTTCN